MHRIVLAISFVICTLSLGAEFPQQLALPVTYFDFHSDGSCPDFNPVDDRDTVTRHMVSDTLKDGFPTSGPRCYFSQALDKWFRPFSEHSDKNIIPTYLYDHYNEKSHGTVESMITVSDDTSYINQEIPGQLELQLSDAATGTYSFSSSAFFPLDGKGFGKEWTVKWDNSGYVYDRNYSFTMKMQHKFTYNKGKNLFFAIEGDDDIWVYLNGKLFIDLGGIHAKSSDTIQLDEVVRSYALTHGEEAVIDLFFAERQAIGSNLTIRSNCFITNNPPKLLTKVVDQTLPEDCKDTIIFDCDTLFSDESSMLYTVVSLDSTLLIPTLDSDNRCLITGLTDRYGTTNILLTATDVEGLECHDTISITLQSVNDVPKLLTPYSDLTLSEDQADTLLGILSAAFSDDDQLTYTLWSSDSTLVYPLIAVDSSLTVHLLPNASGSAMLVVTATDTGNLAVSDTLNLVVVPVNDGPIVKTPLPDWTVEEDHADTTVALLSSHFSDDDSLTYALTLSDSTLMSVSVDGQSGLRLHLLPNKNGTVSLIVSATDTTGLSVSDTAIIAITSVNDTPIVLKKLDDISLPENCKDTILGSLDGVFSDDDHITFSVSSSDSLLAVPFLKDKSILGLFIESETFGSAEIVVTATDSFNEFVSDTFLVTVVEGNNVPVVTTPFADVVLTEDTGTVVLYDCKDHFHDDEPLQFAIESADSLILTPALDGDGRIQITTVADAFGLATLIVEAKDPFGLRAVDTFTVTLQSVNDTPVALGSINDEKLQSGGQSKKVATVSPLFSDDGPLHYTVLITDSTLLSATLLDDTLSITSGVQGGVTEVTVRAIDEGSLTASLSFEVTIEKRLDPPVVTTPIADQQVLADVKSHPLANLTSVFSSLSPLAYAVSLSDSTYCRLSIDSTQTLVLDAIMASPAVLDVSVTATDTLQQSVTDLFTLSINNKNVAPVLLKPLDDQQLTEGLSDTIIGDLDTIFSDDGPLLYQCSSSDSTLLVALIDLEKRVHLSLKPGKSGVATVILTATDGQGLFACDTVVVTVASADKTPVVVKPIDDVVVLKGSSDTTVAILAEIFSDDGPLTYMVSSGNEALVICNLDIYSRLMLSFPPNAIGKTEVVVTALDETGKSASDIFQVTINSENKPPILVTPFADVDLLEDFTDTTITDLSTHFVDEGPLTFRVTCEDSSVILPRIEAKKLLTLSGVAQRFGVTSCIVEATDGAGLSIADTFLVTVQNVNDAPLLLKPLPDLVATEDDEALLLCTLSHYFADEDPLTFAFSPDKKGLVDLRMDSTNALWVTPLPEAFGIASLIVKASDPFGLFLTDTLTITIERDGNDWGAIFDEDFGMLIPKSLFDVSLSPNPLPTEAEKMTLHLSQTRATYAMVKIYNALGDCLVENTFAVDAGSETRCELLIPQHHSRLRGHSYLMVVTWFDGGELLYRQEKMIGLGR